MSDVLTIDQALAERAKVKSFLERNFPEGPGVKLVTITPKDAAELLLQNEENRTISKGKLAQYIADMKTGRWVVNGETIKVSYDDMLNDGQHRLEAAIQANTSFETFMVYGVERDTRLTVDQGKGRSVGDYLSMGGTVNGTTVGSMARRAVAYYTTKGTSVAATTGISNAMIMEYAAKHAQELQDAIHFANKAPHTAKEIGSKTMFAFWYHILSKKGPKAEEFLTKVMTGTGIDNADNPAYRVREKLSKLSATSWQAKTEIFLRGWTFYRDDKPMKLLKFGSGELPKI